MAFTHQYAEALVKEVQAHIDSAEINPDDMGVTTAWRSVVKVFDREHITYKLPKADSALFLVHMKNRGGLLINAFNAHSKWAKIKRSGGDRSKLDSAWAFELPPSGQARIDQIEANVRLVARSNNYLAPVNGSERYLTVGTGHVTAACKASNHGCATPEKFLQDANGKISKDFLETDSEIKEMLTGIDFNVLPFQVELAWPKLPHLAQRALNASNTVPDQSSELEVAASIAEFTEQQRADNQKGDYGLATQAAIATRPPCSGYADKLSDLARYFGGGVGAPLIKYLDSVSKQFGPNLALGCQLTTILVDCKFYSKVKKYPLLRIALIAAALLLDHDTF